MTATRKIPFFNYQGLFKTQDKEIMATLRDVMSRGAYILQEDLEQFEDNLKQFLNVKHAFGVADGTNALILSLRAAGIVADDQVIYAFAHLCCDSRFSALCKGKTRFG